jgi:DEAD/DEAH box helicase domain-containing protein
MESRPSWDTLPPVRYVHRAAARAGLAAPWPEWVPPSIQLGWAEAGVTRPWLHQASAADQAHAGRHVVLATGTASGKSLGFLLPVVVATYGGDEADGGARSAAITRDASVIVRPRRPHTALYLSPTKALAHDQLRSCAALSLPDWRVTTLDGDTPAADRDWAREYATYVLTNPDMLHRSMLPNHPRWAAFLHTLRYVVVDECHRYRGVFGAQVAQVLRRLRRIAAAYGADPTFILASATSSDPGATAARLVGVSEDEVAVVNRDTSARGAWEMVLWQPEASTDDDAARLLAELVESGKQTIAFVGSRRQAELVAVRAQAQVAGGQLIESYRGGYLAEDRRLVERALQRGTVRGVAATNALELGVDIAGMDAVIIAGFPGTRAALWQQAGRAGRKGTDAEVILIARPHPLDAYLFDHPEALFSTPVEATVLHPENPYVLGPHLAAAAQEHPLTPADERYFGPSMPSLVDRLVDQGALRRRPNGWFWTRSERAVDAIDLRATSGLSIEIIETVTGRVLGHVDPEAAHATVHPGAVYLHQGETYLVDELDEETGEALVRAARPGYHTQARVTSGVSVTLEHRSRELGVGRVHFGEVSVTSQVTGYLRRDELTGTVWDETPLELAQRTLRTAACWWTLDPTLVDESLTQAQLAGGAHAAEHAGLGLLPMFAPCDRWDIGGLSTTYHPDTGQLTVFVHDGQVGGAGFAERAYAVADAWLAATSERLESCPCAGGCPACIVSPTCGQRDQVLDKTTAALLLRLLRSDEPRER